MTGSHVLVLLLGVLFLRDALAFVYLPGCRAECVVMKSSASRIVGMERADFRTTALERQLPFSQQRAHGISAKMTAGNFS